MKTSAAVIASLALFGTTVSALDSPPMRLLKSKSTSGGISMPKMKNSKADGAASASLALFEAATADEATMEEEATATATLPPSLPPSKLPSPVPTTIPSSQPEATTSSAESTTTASTTDNASAGSSSKTMKSTSSDAPKSTGSSKSSKKKNGDGGKKGGEDNDSFQVCVVDDRGFALARTDPQFVEGTPVFTSFGLVEADNSLSAALGIVSSVAGLASAILAGGAALAFANPPLAVALGVAAAIFAVVGILFSLISSIFSDLSDGEVMILNRLTEIINEIRVLRRDSERVLAILRRDIGDQTLDDIANVIDRISSSYEDFVDAAQLNSTSFNGTQEELSRFQESYRESFRISCNELTYTPRDIIRILNGHACGDVEKYPERCTQGEGRNTGECQFGIKQRSYLLDKFRLGEGTSAALVADFKAWILSNMIQAIFLQAVCLPPDQYGCPSENDPVFLENLENSFNAFNETLNIFNATETLCICPCKRLMLDAFDVSALDDASGGVEGWVNLGIETPDDPDNKNLILATRFDEDADGTSLFEEIGYTYPAVVTQADIVHLQFVEEDGGLNPNDITDAESPFNSFENPRWYFNQCDMYPVTYRVTIDNQEIDFQFMLEGVFDDECREARPGYCSSDLPCESATQYCDIEFQCLEKQGGGVPCEADIECLSGDCLNPPDRVCSELTGFEQPCANDLICETGYCFDERCCPLDSGCLTCNTTAVERDCGAGSHCATCGPQPTPSGDVDYCKFDCDFSLCGRLCNAELCAMNCFPDEATG